VDARSDLYSTGCLLYELLTGRPPFTGDSPVAIAYQHVKEPPIPPSRIDPEVPPWADAIVLKAMEKDPADRYQSAGEMRNDIQRALSGAPVAAPMLGDAYAGTRRMGGAATQVAGRTAAIPPYRYGEEDGGPGGPPQRQRRVWPWVVLVTVVVLLIAAILLIKTFSGGSNIGVPNVVGDTLAQARTQITKAGLTPAAPTKEFSGAVPKNHVISTSPAYGNTEPKGTTVHIVVSEGPQPATKFPVPGVINDTRSVAVATLKAKGFNPVVHKVSPQGGASPNTVVNQSPGPGVLEPKGSNVTIDVTARTQTVPSKVIGMQEAVAQQLLSNPPYSYFVTPQPGPGLPGGQYTAGQVYATSPSPGTALPPGSPITIYVVQSASNTPSPNPNSSSPSPTPSDSTTPPPGGGQGGAGASLAPNLSASREPS
jgi:serine/threonine-protein kinase